MNKNMTLRDYIAVHAPQDFINAIIPDNEKDGTCATYMKQVARERYKYADEMLSARQGKG